MGTTGVRSERGKFSLDIPQPAFRYLVLQPSEEGQLARIFLTQTRGEPGAIRTYLKGVLASLASRGAYDLYEVQTHTSDPGVDPGFWRTFKVVNKRSVGNRLGYGFFPDMNIPDEVRTEFADLIGERADQPAA